MRLFLTGGRVRKGDGMALRGLLIPGVIAGGLVLAGLASMGGPVGSAAWAEERTEKAEQRTEQTSDTKSEGATRTAGDEDAEATDDQSRVTDDYDGPPRRVVLRVNQFDTVKGVIELEDDSVMVVRTLDGEMETFSKLQLLQIVRLKDPAPGQQGTVYLLNGQTREGTIIEDGFDEVVMEIEGIRTRFKREDVDFIQLQPTPRQRYERFRQQLTEDQPEQHLVLCEWLFEQKMYEEARAELRQLMSYAPTAEAGKLLRVVEAQIALEQSTEEAESTGAAEERRRRLEEMRARRAAMEAKLISDEDVNLIRVYEIDFRRPPRVAVSRDVIAELIETYSDQPSMPATKRDRDRLYRADPLEIVDLIFDLRARELYPQIRVLSEPHALNIFRRRVHNTWLIHNCATSGCHGGPDAGRLTLLDEDYTDERVRYTNLLILERLEVDPQWPLINYQDPEKSLIIQYGLPRNMARKPHPDVPGWRPAFRDRDDRQIKDAIRWIELMLEPRVEYPVSLDPSLLGKGGEEAEREAASEPADAEDGERPRRER